MTSYPPPIPPIDRTNYTITKDFHALDHNQLAEAIAIVVATLGQRPQADATTVQERIRNLELKDGQIDTTAQELANRIFELENKVGDGGSGGGSEGRSRIQVVPIGGTLYEDTFFAGDVAIYQEDGNVVYMQSGGRFPEDIVVIGNIQGGGSGGGGTSPLISKGSVSAYDPTTRTATLAIFGGQYPALNGTSEGLVTDSVVMFLPSDDGSLYIVGIVSSPGYGAVTPEPTTSDPTTEPTEDPTKDPATDPTDPPAAGSGM